MYNILSDARDYKNARYNFKGIPLWNEKYYIAYMNAGYNIACDGM